jgi:glyoxylase-like metal-dependent hydrolase (beta-lactamase superfamily II)
MMHTADVPLLEAAADSALEWGFTVEQPPPVQRELIHGDRIEVGDLCFRVIHTPGHSPGCICLYGHGVLFSGDTVFRGSIGRTDLPGSSMRDMNSSLQRIVDAVLPETVVYPGHGPSTTLKDEICDNPFFPDRHLHHLSRD